MEEEKQYLTPGAPGYSAEETPEPDLQERQVGA
jgi:hypothetical protein